MSKSTACSDKNYSMNEVFSRPEPTIEDYNRMIEMFTSNVDNVVRIDAYIRRGLLYAEQESYINALEDFSSAIALDPKKDRAYSERGYIKLKMNEMEKAEEDFKKYFVLGNAEKESSTMAITEYFK